MYASLLISRSCWSRKAGAMLGPSTRKGSTTSRLERKSSIGMSRMRHASDSTRLVLCVDRPDRSAMPLTRNTSALARGGERPAGIELEWEIAVKRQEDGCQVNPAYKLGHSAPKQEQASGQCYSWNGRQEVVDVAD